MRRIIIAGMRTFTDYNRVKRAINDRDVNAAKNILYEGLRLLQTA